jgi:hypothetical protein
MSIQAVFRTSIQAVFRKSIESQGYRHMMCQRHNPTSTRFSADSTSMYLGVRAAVSHPIRWDFPVQKRILEDERKRAAVSD